MEGEGKLDGSRPYSGEWRVVSGVSEIEWNERGSDMGIGDRVGSGG